MIYGYIYAIQNKINKKYYIGQTIRNPNTRWKEHIREKKGSIISNAIKKYGKNNFIIEVIDFAKNQTELNQLEESYICLFNSRKEINGYNIRNGGSQGKISEETKKKISRTKKRNGSSKEEKHPLFLSLDDKEIIKLYEKGLSCHKIAKKMNCSHQTILRHLKKNKIKITNKSQWKQKQGLFGFTGVSYHYKKGGPLCKTWHSRIQWNKRRKSLGCYEDPLSGEIVYNLVKKELWK